MSDEPQQQGASSDDDAPPDAGGATPVWGPQTPEGPVDPPRRAGTRRLLPRWRTVLGAGLLLLLVGTGLLTAGYLLVDIPAANSAAVAQSNVYLYSDGSRLARQGEVNREKVSLSEIPLHTQRAVLAAEDRNFYSESAVDLTAMVRAGWNMVQGGGKQSGSTITQQYVKNYYLNQEQTLTRKAKEFFIAVKLDREVSKSDILLGYLNTSYFGRNAYGIEAAAQAYYGKSAAELTLSEGAYLAALVNAPGAYDTRTHPDNRQRAITRWHYVLDGMVEKGWLRESQRRGLTFAEPDEIKPPTGLSGQRGYLVKAVDEYLVRNNILDEQRLAAGGFRITTTIDRDKQEALVDAVDEQLMSELSEEREVDRFVRAGGTSIDPETGEVVAMYGGIDYTRQFVDNATRRDYQVASTFKPIVLASATEHEARTQDGQLITPQTTYDGTSGREVIGPDGPTDFAPENERDRDYGPISVTEAMDKSVNAVYAQMGMDVGPDKVRDTAVKLGVPTDTPGLNESRGAVSLGTATASTLDMAEVYATFADHGRHTPHRLVDQVVRDGERIEVPRAKAERAVSRNSADTVTDVLRGVVEGGTGTAAQAAGRPAAGKTGTAEEDTAAWFAGFTPDLATVVAVMGQNSQTGVQQPLYGALGQERISGSGYPARIWADYTAAALEGTPVRDFDLVTDDATEPSATPSESQDVEPPDSTAPPTSPGPSTTAPPSSEEPTWPTPPPSEPTSPPTSSPTLPPEPSGGPGGGTDGGPGGGTDGGPGGGTDGGTDEGMDAGADGGP